MIAENPDVATELRRRLAQYSYWALLAFCLLLVLFEAMSTWRVTAERDAYLRRLRFWSWVVEHSDAAIFVVDADSTKIEACNNGVAKMLGWNPDRMVGTDFLKLMLVDERYKHAGLLRDESVRDALMKKSHRVRCWVNGVNGLVHVEANVTCVPAIGDPAVKDDSTASPFKFLIILNDPNRVSTLPDQPRPTDETQPNVDP